MNWKRIDIHSHVNFSAYDADRDGVVKRAFESGTAFINVGTQYETSVSALNLAKKYDSGVYAIVGLHPTHTGPSTLEASELGEKGQEFVQSGEDFDSNKYEELLKDPKAVGVGECGLEYFRCADDSKEKQKKDFIAQIQLANKVGKPLMLHIRGAYADAHEILRIHATVRGNSHFFAGTIEDAKKFLDIGFTMSFSGVITFAKQYKELVEYVPIDMMHAETDSPYVAPVPHRGKRNEPAFVERVVEKIAEIKKMPLEQVEKQLMRNAESLFSINLNS